MKLKVCGMKYPKNITDVATLQPDYLGFIFYDKSPRFFCEDLPQLPKNIKKVGVFVNATLETIIKTVNHYSLQVVQLHGEESTEFCKALKYNYSHQSNLDNKKNIEVIKVFSVDDAFNFEVLKPYNDVCDYYLFDTKGELPGGNGYAFNWNTLKAYKATKPFFLSGGIGLNQIESVRSFLKSPESKYCYALDVNSKFEIEAGLKNIEELKTFEHKLTKKQ